MDHRSADACEQLISYQPKLKLTDPEPKGNVCDYPVEVGECSGIFTRYAFDPSSKECRKFTYGGCGGNGNNFATIEECSRTCLLGLSLQKITF